MQLSIIELNAVRYALNNNTMPNWPRNDSNRRRINGQGDLEALIAKHKGQQRPVIHPPLALARGQSPRIHISLATADR